MGWKYEVIASIPYHVSFRNRPAPRRKRKVLSITQVEMRIPPRTWKITSRNWK